MARVSEFSVDELLDREPFILSDATPFREHTNQWYQENAYNSRSFRTILHMDGYVEGIRKNREWMAQPTVRTTERVAQELARADDMVRHKLNSLNRFKLNRARKRDGPKAKPGKSREQVLFEDISFGLHQLAKEAKNSIINPEDSMAYSGLVLAVTGLGKAHQLKQDNDERYGRIRKARDLHADEELVGASFYHALTGTSAAVVTRDYDIPRLVTGTHKYLGPSSMAAVHVYMMQPDGSAKLFVNTEDPETAYAPPFDPDERIAARISAVQRQLQAKAQPTGK